MSATVIIDRQPRHPGAADKKKGRFAPALFLLRLRAASAAAGGGEKMEAVGRDYIVQQPAACESIARAVFQRDVHIGAILPKQIADAVAIHITRTCNAQAKTSEAG